MNLKTNLRNVVLLLYKIANKLFKITQHVQQKPLSGYYRASLNKKITDQLKNTL